MNNLLDRFQRAISGGVYGMLSISFGLIGDLVALALFPGYNFLKRSVSFLCKGPGGTFFQIGTTLSGIFAIFFVLYVIRTFDDDTASNTAKKWALSFALISCITFTILGIFCGSNPIVDLIHGVSAVISWLSGICYITLYSVFILKDAKYAKFVAYFGFSVSISLSLMVLMFFVYFLPGMQIIVLILPLWEWFDTLLLSAWYGIVSLYLLVKRI